MAAAIWLAATFVSWDTGLNELLIFGRLGLPAMGAAGAAIATVIAQCVNFLLLLLASKQLAFLRAKEVPHKAERLHWSRYLSVLLPLLFCEASWSLGENVYAAIYGRMGTAESAAMTLTAPIQGLVIGALCGLSQAAGVIVGKRLGGEDYDEAYQAAKRLMVYGAVGAAVLCTVVLLTSGAYVEIYRVSPTVKLMTRQILSVYAMAAPFKVLNMILGGGILRSGGHMGLRRPAGPSGRVCLETAHRVRLSAPVAGGMRPLRNLHGGLPPQTLDETAGRVIHAGFIAAENGRSR